jgi:hypothetical protein
MLRQVQIFSFQFSFISVFNVQFILICVVFEQVVVRIRPKEGDCVINKVSSDALCVGDRQFNFDQVFYADSNQVVDRELSLDLMCV